MPISVRKRGEIWHARGSVRIGRETVPVPEFSTGCRDRGSALAAASAEEARIRKDRTDGPAGRRASVTLSECFSLYLHRPKTLRLGDRQRVVELAKFMGTRTIDQAPAGWTAWLRDRGGTMKPASAARMLSTLRAAIRYGCTAMDLGAAPVLVGVKQPRHEPAPYLTTGERERLLSAYTPAAGRVALMLAYQGLRTQEALRLEWRHIDMDRETIRVVDTKSGRDRTMPLHPRVKAMLAEIDRAEGHVFLSTRGQPYADTRGRDGGQQGGNPLAQAHTTACTKAGIKNFRVHDFRHDWATRLVEAGTPIVVLMQLGGWSSMRMVQRYATIESGQLREAVSRLK